MNKRGWMWAREEEGVTDRGGVGISATSRRQTPQRALARAWEVTFGVRPLDGGLWCIHRVLEIIATRHAAQHLLITPAGDGLGFVCPSTTFEHCGGCRSRRGRCITSRGACELAWISAPPSHGRFLTGRAGPPPRLFPPGPHVTWNFLAHHRGREASHTTAHIRNHVGTRQLQREPRSGRSWWWWSRGRRTGGPRRTRGQRRRTQEGKYPRPVQIHGQGHRRQVHRRQRR